MGQEVRHADHPILPLLLNRCSPRAMSGEPITNEEILSLFEAARWAPSSFNSQPWRFLFAKRDTPQWPLFFNLLVDFNKEWCQKAALLGLIASATCYEKNQKPSPSHALDTGAAWENLNLEGAHRKLVVHGMSGFDYAKARTILKIPQDFEVLAMFAVGRSGNINDLSPALRAKEVPSNRKKVEEFAFEGEFRK